MNAMRLTQGVAVSLFEQRTGLDVDCLCRGIAQAQELGLLERNTERLRPTPNGRAFLNELLLLFDPA